MVAPDFATPLSALLRSPVDPTLMSSKGAKDGPCKGINSGPLFESSNCRSGVPNEGVPVSDPGNATKGRSDGTPVSPAGGEQDGRVKGS